MTRMEETRQRLRDHAEKLRLRAAGSPHAVARHLFLSAAKRLDQCAAAAMSAEHTALQAERYEAEPGGERDAE